MRAPLLITAIAATSCSAPQLEVIPRFQQFEIEGEFAADATGITGTNSLSALGIDDDPIEFSPRVDFSMGPFEITADYLDVSYSGTGDVDTEIDFNGQTFTVGTTVDTDIDLKLARASATWDWIPTDVVDFGLGVGAAYTKAFASVRDTGFGNTATTEEEAPFPFLAARARVALADVSVELLAGYLSFNYDDIDASYLDVDALARWAVIGGDEHLAISLLVGYRFLDLDLEYVDGGDNVRIEAELQGPYAGLSLTL